MIWFDLIWLSSTASALICLHEKITGSLDNDATLGVIILAYDFSKAFDKLGHDVIIDTLRTNSLPVGFVQWILEYLNNRTQIVKIDNNYSCPLTIKSGIPQGSVIGPFLFNLVVGSLHPVYDSTTIVKYVDDCTFVIPITRDQPDCYHQEHVNMLRWSTSVGLRLNTKKCKYLWIPKSTHCVPPVISDFSVVSELKILGVYFSSNLKWKKQIDYVNKRASCRLYALRVLKPCLDRTELIAIYHGLILSLLEYCSPVMIGMMTKDEYVLDRIQRRAHRVICGKDCNCDCLPNLRSRREAAAIKLLNRIAERPSHPLHDLCPKRSYISQRFIMPAVKTSRRLNSFFPMSVILANNTHLHVHVDT